MDEFFCPACRNSLEDGEYCEDCGRMRCPNGCGHYINRMQDEVECRYCKARGTPDEREAEKLKAEREAKSVNQNLEVESLAHEASKLLRLRMPGWAKALSFNILSRPLRADGYKFVDSIWGRKKTGPIKWNLNVVITFYREESIVGFAYKEWVSDYKSGTHYVRPDDEIFRLPLTEENIPLAVDRCVDYLLLMKNKRL